MATGKTARCVADTTGHLITRLRAKRTGHASEPAEREEEMPAVGGRGRDTGHIAEPAIANQDHPRGAAPTGSTRGDPAGRKVDARCRI